MQILQGLPDARQAATRNDLGGEVIGERIQVAVQGALDDRAELAVGEAGGGGIEGDDAPGVDQLGLVAVQNLVFRTGHGRAALPAHLAVDHHRPAGEEPVLEEGLVEPQAAQHPGAVVEQQGEDGQAAPGPGQAGIGHPAEDGDRLPGPKAGDRLGQGTVQIAPGRVEEQVANAHDPQLGHQGGPARADPLEVLDAAVKHAAGKTN